jgi:hypothetical protein
MSFRGSTALFISASGMCDGSGCRTKMPVILGSAFSLPRVAMTSASSMSSGRRSHTYL